MFFAGVQQRSFAAAPAVREPLLVEGFRLMRERWPVYAAFALACSAAAALALPRIDMYATLASNPCALVTTPPVSIVLGLSLAALFFILPSALRRIEPGFKMTALRLGIMLATLLGVGLVTELGYALAILPGIVAGVLLSQALIGALLRTREGAGPRELGRALGGALRGSFDMTKSHFATTFGVVVASLFIVLVPFTAVLLALAILGVRLPPSLTVMSPLLLLTFVYFECVRYALIVRWYRRLAEDRPLASP